MRRLRMRGCTIVGLGCAGIALFSLLFSPPAVAQTYLGDICWKLTVTERVPGPVPPPHDTFLVRTGLTYVGGQHLLFQGTFDYGGGVAILNGAGELVGTDLVISMFWTRDHLAPDPFRDPGALEMRVNVGTWTGTWWAVNTWFNRTTRGFGHDYGAGPVELVTCP